jgi:hypothetical protein
MAILIESAAAANWIKAIEINQETFCKPIISIKEVFSQSAVLDYAGYYGMTN